MVLSLVWSKILRPLSMKKLDNDIIIAAGGLGTRIDGWSSIIPKEFLPYHDRPTILHLLSEAALLSDGNIYYVYHPYYEMHC